MELTLDLEPVAAREMQTAETIVRYVAFDNPCVWVQRGDVALPSGGTEVAVYHEPMQNTEYPHISDGLYIEITSYQGQDYLASGHATRPDIYRQQTGFHGRYKTFIEAKQACLEWLPKGSTWCRKVTPRQARCTRCGREVPSCPTMPGFCQVDGLYDRFLHPACQ